MSNIDLASEMAAARKRLTERTARAIRDSRVLAIRAAVRPGATQTEIEELARSFYPRLNADLLAEATNLVFEMQRGSTPAAAAEKPAEPALEAPAENA